MDEIIEVPSGNCGLGGHNIDTFILPCIYLAPDAVFKCSHPAYNPHSTMRKIDAVGCNARSIMFVRKIDYLNWKMTNGNA